MTKLKLAVREQRNRNNNILPQGAIEILYPNQNGRDLDVLVRC
jgi:hypothetical protein